MKGNTFAIKAMTLLIVGLMIAMSAAALPATSERESKEIKISNVGNIAKPMQVSYAKTVEPIQNPINTLTAQPLYMGYTPTIAADQSNVCLGFQDENTVWFTGSTDGGTTWPENGIGYEIAEIPEFPDVDSCGNGRFIGGMVPNYMDNMGGALYKWIISDLTDFSTEGYGLLYWTFNDLGEGYTDFLDVGVGGYTSGDEIEDSWAYGATTMQGDVGGVGPQPLMSYQANEEGIARIYTFGGELQGGDITSCDIDPDTKYMYGVWNFLNTSSGNMDILIDIMDFGTWEDYEGYPIHPEVGALSLSTEGSNDYLDISARNDNVIVVSERDGQIIAYSTADGFTSTLQEKVISTSGSEPRITHTDDNTATCVFIDGGDLYMSISEDGGISWSTPVIQSESEGALAADVSALGHAYEGSDGKIYYSQGAGDFPIIGIESISGGIGVTSEISNTGTGDATDVPYSLSATGGILGMINKEVEGTISITAGSTSSISLPMIIGLGTVTIDVSVGSASETIEGTQLLFFTSL